MLDDKKSSLPLHRQIYEALRGAILKGDFRAQAKLPSSRALAAQLGVSRTTVVVAYDQLYAEGYLEGKSGAGTFVAAELPEELRQAASSRKSLSSEESSAATIESFPARRVPDRKLTRRIVRFNSDQRYADGWTGRRLRRFFRAAGLKETEVETLVQVDTEKSSYLFGMAERIANAAAEVGEISPQECRKGLEQLNESAEGGNFFSSINYYICVGIRIS